MYQSAKPDMLSEFCVNEKGAITSGKVGDQTGNESHVRGYYDYPWDGILAYSGKADEKPACKVQLYGTNDTAAQKWALAYVAASTYYLVNLVSGKALDVANGGQVSITGDSLHL